MSDNTSETTPTLGEPTTHSQRMAHLRVSAALHQAREQSQNRARRLARVQGADYDAPAMQDQLDEDRAGAEARLVTVPWMHPEAVAVRLADALTWHEESPVAAERLHTLIDHYATSAGLRIDPVELAVTVDPEFDAEAEQTFQDAAVLFSRDLAAHDMLKHFHLPEEMTAVIAPRLDDGITFENAGDYIDSSQERRERLTELLDASEMTETSRATVEFVVDYLHGDTTNLDLLQTPALVDPAREVRGRVGELLAQYEGRGDSFGVIIANEIAVMTPADRKRVERAGAAIRMGEPGDGPLWPDAVDRDYLDTQLRMFASLTRDAAACSAIDGVGGEVPALLGSVQQTRAALLQALDGDGLHPIEQAHLRALIDDIDVGNRDERTLPELIWADERSKQRADLSRHDRTAASIADGTYTRVQLTVKDSGVDLTQKPAATSGLDRTWAHIRFLAEGGHSPAELNERREDYNRDLLQFGRALTAAGVDSPTRYKVREVIDSGTRAAGQHGKTRGGREAAWHVRIASTAATAHQQRDTAAQRAAAAAGRVPPPDRACTTRPAPSTSQTAARGNTTRATRREQRTEVGR